MLGDILEDIYEDNLLEFIIICIIIFIMAYSVGLFIPPILRLRSWLLMNPRGVVRSAASSRDANYEFSKKIEKRERASAPKTDNLDELPKPTFFNTSGPYPIFTYNQMDNITYEDDL